MKRRPQSPLTEFGVTRKTSPLWGGSAFRLGGISLLLFLVACTTPNQKSASLDEPAYTLIFIDKTRSVNVNQAFVADKYGQAIDRILAETMRQTGDKLDVYFIHDNTARARALSLTVRSERDPDAGSSATDREAADTDFTLHLQREQTAFRQKIRDKLAQQNPGTSNRQTDIWASLEVLEKANETGCTIRAFYLSDMLESTTGPNRRDFGKQPPANAQQANDWAKTDAKLLEKYTIGSPIITLMLPFEPTASAQQNNPNVGRYWQILFETLGASEVMEE